MDERKEQARKLEDELSSMITRYGEEFPEITMGDIITILEKEKFYQLCRLHGLVQQDHIDASPWD
jgi:hypothetical protein